MKKQASIFSTISPLIFSTLTTVVSETLANIENSKKPPFTVAELWNIQRQGKMRVQRRFSL